MAKIKISGFPVIDVVSISDHTDTIFSLLNNINLINVIGTYVNKTTSENININICVTEYRVEWYEV